MHVCDYCKAEFNQKSSLNRHQTTVKSCIAIQLKKNISVEIRLVTCEYCNKKLSSNTKLKNHISICKFKNKSEKTILKEQIQKLSNEVLQLKEKSTEIDRSLYEDSEEFEINLNIYTNTLENNQDKISSMFVVQKEIEKQFIIKDVQPLVINDYTLIYRKEDGYVDVTNLCKAGEKKFNHWNSLEKTQAFIKVLSFETGIPASKLIEVISGGNFKNQGTWAHPQVAINIAQWISPEFDVKVSKWVFELMITGKVELGNEKTNEELEIKYIEQIKSLTNEIETKTTELETNKQEYQLLLTKHNSSLKNHRYVKFKESDPCFYIIDSGILCDCGQPNTQYKFGIAGTDQHTIDDRLQSHRTLWPLLKVRFLLFIKEVSVIEKTFKMMYEKEINPNGHEIIEGVLIEDMIDRLKKLFDLLCIKDYHIMSEEKLKEYNDYVDTTIKTKD